MVIYVCPKLVSWYVAFFSVPHPISFVDFRLNGYLTCGNSTPAIKVYLYVRQRCLINAQAQLHWRAIVLIMSLKHTDAISVSLILGPLLNTVWVNWTSFLCSNRIWMFQTFTIYTVYLRLIVCAFWVWLQCIEITIIYRKSSRIPHTICRINIYFQQ